MENTNVRFLLEEILTNWSGLRAQASRNFFVRLFVFGTGIFKKLFRLYTHSELRTSELEAQGTQVGGKYRVADVGSAEESVFL